MRALSSTGWTSGAATYDSGFETHNLDRPAPRCLALLSGLVEVIPHLVPSPVAFSTSQPPRRFRVHSKLPKPRDLQHNHARYDVPEIIAIPAADGSDAYLDWLRAQM